MLEFCTRQGWFDLHDFIVLGIDCGFRCGEMLMLPMEWEFGGAYVLPPGARKNKKPLRIPHSARVAVIAQARRDAGFDRVFPFLTLAVLRKQWGALREALGETDNEQFTPHRPAPHLRQPHGPAWGAHQGSAGVARP